VTIELFQRWLAEDTVTSDQASARSRPESLQSWFQLADELLKDAPPGPSAREIPDQDRGRLDRSLDANR
jgi:hypothetical protein